MANIEKAALEVDNEVQRLTKKIIELDSKLEEFLTDEIGIGLIIRRKVRSKDKNVDKIKYSICFDVEATKDSKFPFKPQEKILIKVENKGLRIESFR